MAQAQCDKPEDGEKQLPVEVDIGQRFYFSKIIATSAKNPDGLDELLLALRKAIAYNRQKHGQQQIANSWVRVKEQLEQWIIEDSNKPEGDRQHQLLSQQGFFELCRGKGESPIASSLIVADEAVQTLLQMLHVTGVVFYQKGLFNGQILLDQSWALNAIYAVFHRESALHNIVENEGVFHAQHFGRWLWNDLGYSQKEQALFLGMMQSCGICFSYNQQSQGETKYVVPELLPNVDSSYINDAIERNWQDKDSEIVNHVFTVDLLHKPLFNRVLSLIGSEAGDGAIYWQDGLLTFETEYKSWLMFEREMSSDWQGTFVLSARGGNAKGLLDDIIELIEQEQQKWHVQLTKIISHSVAGNKKPSNIKQFVFKSSFPEVCISYKWNDRVNPDEEREKIVNQFCDVAESRGIRVIRDKSSLGLGEKISAFMQLVGSGKRVIIILSDAYLKSPNCMFELSEIWRNCRGEAKLFTERVKVFCLASAKIFELDDRMDYAIFWKDKYERVEERLRQHGTSILGKESFSEHQRVAKFWHCIEEILKEISDTLGPQDFEQLLNMDWLVCH